MRAFKAPTPGNYEANRYPPNYCTPQVRQASCSLKQTSQPAPTPEKRKSGIVWEDRAGPWPPWAEGPWPAPNRPTTKTVFRHLPCSRHLQGGLFRDLQTRKQHLTTKKQTKLPLRTTCGSTSKKRFSLSPFFFQNGEKGTNMPPFFFQKTPPTGASSLRLTRSRRAVALSSIHTSAPRSIRTNPRKRPARSIETGRRRGSNRPRGPLRQKTRQVEGTLESSRRGPPASTEGVRRQA